MRALPVIDWRCATCARAPALQTATRLPVACPYCLSERDARHGPQPLTAAGLFAAVKAEEIALEAAQARYTADLRPTEVARRDLENAMRLHSHLARRLCVPFVAEGVCVHAA